MQGKLIEIHFSTMGKICGAKIQTCKTVWVKYVHIKLALFWFLFIFLFFQFNDLTYSYDFVFLSYVNSHMLTWTVLLEKVTWDALLNKSVKLKYLLFFTSEIILSPVASQELFNLPWTRGHITYFINFVLDLHLILKVHFLRSLSISLHTWMLLCIFEIKMTIFDIIPLKWLLTVILPVLSSVKISSAL